MNKEEKRVALNYAWSIRDFIDDEGYCDVDWCECVSRQKRRILEDLYNWLWENGDEADTFRD